VKDVADKAYGIVSVQLDELNKCVFLGHRVGYSTPTPVGVGACRFLFFRDGSAIFRP
jgi:hypothetical protein